MDPPLLETQSPWVLIDFLTPQTQKIMQEHLLFTGFKTLPNERVLNSPNPVPSHRQTQTLSKKPIWKSDHSLVASIQYFHKQIQQTKCKRRE